MSEDGHDAQAEAAARLGEAAAAVAAAFQPLLLAVAGALQVLAADPVVRFAMDHPELLRGERPKPCHCLCATAHPFTGWGCDGEAVTVRRLTTMELGPVEVPLCAPCAEAQGITP